MAMFCGKCGTAIQPGSKFCGSCGALSPQLPVPAAPAPPQPSPHWTPPAQAGPGQPMAAPPPVKSGGALKVVLIILAGFVVLVVIVVVAAGLFIRKTVLDNVSVKEGPGGKAEVSINTPGGQINLNAKTEITEEKLGVPIYPGAQAIEGAGTLTFTGADSKGGSIGGAAFTTSDSLEKVVDFYKSRLGNKVNVFEATSQGKHSVVLNVSAQNAWRTITVEDEGNGVTKIAVASMVGSAPQ
jgi:hypothetical protein